MKHAASLLLCAVLVVGTAVACGDDDDITGTGNAPASHTVSEDGVRHLPGLMDPQANCTACHGADLRGGNNGEPSCFSCHGQQWP
jgi:hypothetical protein